MSLDSEFSSRPPVDGPALAAFASGEIPAVQAAEAHSRSREELASDVIEYVLRAAHRLRGLLAAHFGSIGLSDVRYAVLRIVRDHAPLGCTQAEVANRLDQSESSVSALIERMRESNLIYRLRSKTDRRKRVLILTELGRQMLAEAESNYGRRVAALLAHLEPEQLANLAVALRELCDKLLSRSDEESRLETPPLPVPQYLRAAELVDPLELQRHRPVA